jgi:hypothetical protein
MLWKWTKGLDDWQLLVPGGAATQARRFFVNPYDPSVIYVLDLHQIMRSDDGGAHWQQDDNLQQQLTCNGLIPVERLETDPADVVLTDMQFNPFDSDQRVAVGLAGAFSTNDGVNWQRLLDTAALPGRPTNCYWDWVSNAPETSLYVATSGRSLVKISPLP